MDQNFMWQIFVNICNVVESKWTNFDSYFPISTVYDPKRRQESANICFVVKLRKLTKSLIGFDQARRRGEGPECDNVAVKAVRLDTRH